MAKEIKKAEVKQRKKPGPKVVTGQQGARFLRFWHTLMILAEEEKGLSAEDLNLRLKEILTLRDYVGRVSTTRTDLHTMVTCGLPVKNVDANGEEIVFDEEIEDRRGRNHNTRWKLCEGNEIGRFSELQRGPTPQDVAVLSILRNLLNDHIPSNYPLYRQLGKAVSELYSFIQNRNGAPHSPDRGVIPLLVLSRQFKISQQETQTIKYVVDALRRNLLFIADYTRADGQSKRVTLQLHYPWVANGKGYVLASNTKDPESENPKNYRLDRFSNIETSPTARLGQTPPALEAKVKKLIDGAFNGYIAEPSDVVLTIEPEIEYLFDSSVYHPSQKIIKQAGRPTEIHFHCAVGYPLEELILGFGEFATVISPSDLRERVVERHRAALARY